MFHVVYSRHLHDRENGYGSFESRWTILRNVPYSQIGEYTTEKLIKMASRYDIKYKAYIDTTYSQQEQESWDKDQCYHTECYIVDDEDYYKTYKDIYPDTYIPGAIDEKEDYFHNYGQMSTFMLEQDYGRI